MAVILAQVSIQSVTGLPEDRITNTFHFNGAATTPVAEDLVDCLYNFYNAANTSLTPLCGWLSPVLVDGSAVNSMKFFDVTPPGPAGTPFFEYAWQLGATGEDPLPNEVSCCLSYKATPLPGAQEARRRGRVYIGPLSTLVMDNGIPTKPTANFITTLLDAAARLHDESAAANAPWVIFSRVNGTTALATTAWVDNAFDTQRRRGEAPTARTAIAL